MYVGGEFLGVPCCCPGDQRPQVTSDTRALSMVVTGDASEGAHHNRRTIEVRIVVEEHVGNRSSNLVMACKRSKVRG